VLAVGGLVAVKAMGGGSGSTAAAPPPPTPSTGVVAGTPPAGASTAVAPDKRVTIKVVSNPIGAEVFRGDIFVGRSPTEFATEASDEPIELLVKAAGFVDERRKIVPSADGEYDLRLTPVTPTTAVAEKPTPASSGRSSRSRTERSRPMSAKPERTNNRAGNNTLAPDF